MKFIVSDKDLEEEPIVKANIMAGGLSGDLIVVFNGLPVIYFDRITGTLKRMTNCTELEKFGFTLDSKGRIELGDTK